MNYLLSTIACLFVLSEIVVARPGDYHVAVREKCFAEYGLDHAPKISAYFANPKAKCYLKCFLEGKKLINENGHLEAAGIVSLIDNDESVQEQAKPLAEKCVSKYSETVDGCEKSYEVIKCFFDGSPSVFPQMGVFEPPYGW